jgi:hypothetical protein
MCPATQQRSYLKPLLLNKNLFNMRTPMLDPYLQHCRVRIGVKSRHVQAGSQRTRPR